jgi:hypothetical protein
MFATFKHEKTISKKILVYKMYKMQLIDGHIKTISRIIIPHTTVELLTINWSYLYHSLRKVIQEIWSSTENQYKVQTVACEQSVLIANKTVITTKQTECRKWTLGIQITVMFITVDYMNYGIPNKNVRIETGSFWSPICSNATQEYEYAATHWQKPS